MSRGMGSMLHYLGGGSPKSAEDYYGRKITSATLKKDREHDDRYENSAHIILGFDDGVKVKIWDGGQSCCESRYMTCDDNIGDLIGHVLTKIEVKEGPDAEGSDEYSPHEQCFLEIQAGHETVTVCTHNEHNGYYGGFGLSLDEVEK